MDGDTLICLVKNDTGGTQNSLGLRGKRSMKKIKKNIENDINQILYV